MPSWGDPQKNTVTFPFFCAEMDLKTLSQFGLPAFVRVLRPVIKSRLDWNKKMHWISHHWSWSAPNYRYFFSDFGIIKKHDLTFLCSRSSASWSPTAFMSVFWSAEVMYICMSKNRSIEPPCSACSISSWDNKFTNHSKLLWSRLIQKKSTCEKLMIKILLWIIHMSKNSSLLCS